MLWDVVERAGRSMVCSICRQMMANADSPSLKTVPRWQGRVRLCWSSPMLVCRQQLHLQSFSLQLLACICLLDVYSSWIEFLWHLVLQMLFNLFQCWCLMRLHCSLRGSTDLHRIFRTRVLCTDGSQMVTNGISCFDLQSKILILSGLTVGALALWQRRRSRSISPEPVEKQDVAPHLSHFAVMQRWHDEMLKSLHPIRCLG